MRGISDNLQGLVQFRVLLMIKEDLIVGKLEAASSLLILMKMKNSQIFNSPTG